MTTGLLDLDAHASHALAELTGRIDWDRLTDEYLNARDEAAAGWRRLASWTRHHADLIFDRLDVCTVSSLDEPYRSEHAQHADIAHGVFVVSSRNCAHPHWSPLQCVDFRLWHYVDGHEELRAPFDRFGEVLVFARHADQLRFELSLGSPADRLLCIDALFSETIYRQAHFISAGHDDDGRCVRLGKYGRVVRDAIRFVFPDLIDVQP